MQHLNLNLGYFTHRKTRRLVCLLGRGADVLPLRIWCHCGVHHPLDGELADYTVKEIETIAEWWGKPGEMVTAMLEVVFLEHLGTGYCVHGWKEVQGHIAAYTEKGKVMAKARWDKARNAASIAQDLSKLSPNQLTKPTELTDITQAPFYDAIAERLRTKEFVSGWMKFVSFREGILKKPLNQQSAAIALNKLARFDIPTALEAIDTAILSQWTGVFPESVGKGRRAAPPAPVGPQTVKF